MFFVTTIILLLHLCNYLLLFPNSSFPSCFLFSCYRFSISLLLFSCYFFSCFFVLLLFSCFFLSQSLLLFSYNFFSCNSFPVSFFPFLFFLLLSFLQSFICRGSSYTMASHGSWRLISPANRQFAQKLIPVNSTRNNKIKHYWSRGRKPSVISGLPTGNVLMSLCHAAGKVLT